MTTNRPVNADLHLRLDGGGWERVGLGATAPLASIRNLKKHFAIGRTLFGTRPLLRAVDGVDLEIRRGETFGLVSESDCGKSTLARTLICLYQPTSGQMLFDGQDIATLSERDLTPLRRRVQMIFQDPYASLNGRMSVCDLIAEPFEIARIGTSASRTAKVHDLLSRVGLHPDRADLFAHEFSSGQCQRIGIARAIALEPELVICDEPISALDVSVLPYLSSPSRLFSLCTGLMPPIPAWGVL